MNVQPTDPARSIFEVALDMVEERGDDQVREEHVVMGILGLEAGSAAEAMTLFKVDRAAVRANLEATLGVYGSGLRAFRDSGVHVSELVAELRTRAGDAE